jgi:glucosamine--fructose-6-phosphate aminotransferase (isomerizing)
VIGVPEVDSSLAFVLSAMVGHLFGYEAARAIDDLARSLREAREVVEHAVVQNLEADEVLALVQQGLVGVWERFVQVLRSGSYDGHLEASTAVQLTSMLRILGTEGTTTNPVEVYQLETGKVGTPAALLDDLTMALTRAIEELTRPIDAIKHQAKTVTVGISRSDEGVLGRSLVQQVMATGTSRDVLSYRHLKILAELDPAVVSVNGYTRYRIEGDPLRASATISIVDRGGMSVGLASRVETNGLLVGTKRRVAMEREVLVARGRSDGRTVIFIPEIKGGHTVGITLLHVSFHDFLPSSVMRQVLQGYDRRYDRLVDWVSETEGSMRDELLSEIPVSDLLILPISDVADRWRSTSS